MIEKSRAPRKVAIADHLWEAFEQMAEEMGADREALINQAMFMFARLNGFLTPGAGAAASAPASAPAADLTPPRPRVAAAPEPPEPPPTALEEDDEDDDFDEPVAEPEPPRELTPVRPVEARSDNTEARRRQVEERVLETAAQLERQIKGGRAEPPEPPPGLGIEDGADDLIDDDEIVDELMGEVQRKSLYLMAEDGELDKVDKERFLLGRGKHCDFIIQSGKVSREHAVISQDGDEWFIEDLGSSNGTWFQKKRIKRRKIEDGDEFFICSEKVKCVIR